MKANFGRIVLEALSEYAQLKDPKAQVYSNDHRITLSKYIGPDPDDGFKHISLKFTYKTKTRLQSIEPGRCVTQRLVNVIVSSKEEKTPLTKGRAESRHEIELPEHFSEDEKVELIHEIANTYATLVGQTYQKPDIADFIEHKVQGEMIVPDDLSV